MCQSDIAMKFIGLCGTTFTILLICNPVVHCFWNEPQILVTVDTNYVLLVSLTNRITTLENLIQQIWTRPVTCANNALPQFDGRLTNVEASVNSIISQMKSTSTQLTNADKTLAAIKKSIESLSSTVSTNVAAISASIDQINRRLDNTDPKLNSTQIDRELNLSKDTMRAMCMGIAVEDNSLERQISDSGKLLKKYDEKLNTYNNTVDGLTNNLVELNGRLIHFQETCHNNITQVMERQEREIKEIQRLLFDADKSLKDLPNRSDTRNALNLTLDAIENIGHDITEIKNNYLTKMTNEPLEVKKTASDQAYNDIMSNFNTLSLEIQALSEKESLILQKATKIDVVHESIFLEIKDLIKGKTQHLNNNLNNSTNEAQPSVVGNQISALLATANKIESRMECISCDIMDIYDEVIVDKTRHSCLAAAVTLLQSLHTTSTESATRSAKFMHEIERINEKLTKQFNS